MNQSAIRKPTILPADPNPRKPKFALPPGACDCHAHVFGPQSQFPYAPNAKYIPHDQTVQDYVHMLKTIGCTRAVIVQASCYVNDHSAMVNAMRSGLFDFRGVAVVREDVTDRELQELHDAGVRAVRINLASKTPGLSLDAAPEMAQRIKALGWHLEFYLHIDEVPQIADRLSSLPVDIVIDHFGRARAEDGVDSPGFRILLNLLARDNCWAKLMGAERISNLRPHFADVAPLAKRMLEVAPDRLVWGTDWPHPALTHIPNDGDLADLLLHWCPDERLRHKILVDNPARLYGFA